jgi:hypothetical protein
MNKDDQMFMSGPIPGMSLTGAPRNVPWENPPMLATVEDTIGYYVDKLLDHETEDNILDVLDNKVDIETIADSIITSSVMNGIHSLDVGFLINPVVRELIMLVADSTGTEYIESYKQQEKSMRIPRSMARQIVRQAMQEQQTSMAEPTQSMPTSMGTPPMPTDMGTPSMPTSMGQEIPPEYRGLMAPVNAPQAPVR